MARDPWRRAGNLQDVFGWNRVFDDALLPPKIVECMRRGGALQAVGRQWRSRVRFSSLEGSLFLHSAWPTSASDAVFFGPDTYRFARFVRANLPATAPSGLRVCEVCCGSGAVGLITAQCLGPETELHLVDINPVALTAAYVNAELAGVRKARIYISDLLQSVQPSADLVICNPPYLPDSAHRLYRDGGNDYGTALSLKLVQQALRHLRPGGRMLMYTGTAVIAGEPVLARRLLPLLEAAARERALRYRYEELDPDVFGEELELPGLADVERIAVVGLTVQIAP